MQKLGFFSSEAHRCCLDISSPAFEEVQKLSVSLGQLKVAWIQTGLQNQKGTPILPILDTWGLPGYKQDIWLKKVHQLYPSWTIGGCLDTSVLKVTVICMFGPRQSLSASSSFLLFFIWFWPCWFIQPSLPLIWWDQITQGHPIWSMHSMQFCSQMSKDIKI